MTNQPTDSPEASLLLGLQALLAPLTAAAGTLWQFNPDAGAPDEQWALGYTSGPTDPESRWARGVLTLLTRGPRRDPLKAHGIAFPLVRRLTGLHGVPFALVSLTDSEHRGYATWVDSNSRTVRADTFFLDLDYPA